MNRLIRLSKSGIEYLDYAWNFYSGCRHKENLDSARLKPKCPPVPCWAEELTKRFKSYYPDGFAPHIYSEAFLSPLNLKKPTRIGVCFMGDLFGNWVDPEQKIHIKIDYHEFDIALIKEVKFIIKSSWQQTFVFLTKNPAGMRHWGKFPDNCEVGFSAWSPDSFIEGLRELSNVEAKVNWCSLEPLLDWNTEVAGNAWELLDWVAIGALTGTKKQIMELAKVYPALWPMKLSAGGNRWGLLPPLDWLKNIVEACNQTGTKVFLKDNIYKVCMERPAEDHDLYWEDLANLRQECGASARGLGLKAREKAGV
jgi:protein gp37